jgi:hypothetical protein
LNQQNIDLLRFINIAKFTPIFQAYKKGKFPGVTDADFKEILKYM